MDAKSQRILNIYETGVSETELTETLKTKINASTGGSLGSIKPTDAAPTPARNGNYTFSVGGAKPAWLTAEAGITAVKAGDGVAVVYTEPSSYTYTHVDTGSSIEQARSQSTSKVPSSKLLDDELFQLQGNLYSISGYINSLGVLIAGADYLSTDYLYISKNKDVIVTGYAGSSSSLIAFYDVNKVFISNISGAGTANQTIIVPKASIPANAVYVRGNCKTDSINPRISAFNLNALLAYTNNKLTAVDANFTTVNNSISTINGNLLTPTFEYTKNLFNLNDIITGEYVKIPSDAAGVGNGVAYSTSNFIAVKASTQYYASGYKGLGYSINVAFYQSDKITLIGSNTALSKTGGLFATPANCAYIKITAKAGPDDPGDLSAVQVEEGNIATSYMTHKFVVLLNNYPLKEYANKIAEKPTDGTKWLIFGDSITAPTSWVDYIVHLTGASALWNRAISGSSYKDDPSHISHTVTQLGDDGLTYYVQDASEQIKCAKVETDIVSPDIVVIAMGTNDGIASLGDYTTAMSKVTLNDLDRTKLYEAIRWTYWTLRINYPAATFYTSTPIHRASNEPYPALSTAIKAMANRYNFIVIDTENESGIVRDFEVNGANGLYLHDGLHPYNVAPFAGDKLIAKCIATKVLSTFIKL